MKQSQWDQANLINSSVNRFYYRTSKNNLKTCQTKISGFVHENLFKPSKFIAYLVIILYFTVKKVQFVHKNLFQLSKVTAYLVIILYCTVIKSLKKACHLFMLGGTI